MTVRFEVDDIGRKAVVTGLWTPHDGDAIRRDGVRRLVIAVREKGLEFLKELDEVEEINVIDHVLPSDGGVMTLPGLRELGLETYSNDAIDFRVFRRLERLHLNWRPGAETAFECPSLRSLSVAGCPLTNLGPLSGLSALEGLRIASARRLTSLDGVQHLPNIRTLWLLDDRALVDLEPLANTGSSLTELWLSGCRKVTDISALARHTDLRRLALIDCGRIASLKPGAGASSSTFWWRRCTEQSRSNR